MKLKIFFSEKFIPFLAHVNNIGIIRNKIRININGTDLRKQNTILKFCQKRISSVYILHFFLLSSGFLSQNRTTRNKFHKRFPQRKQFKFTEGKKEKNIFHDHYSSGRLPLKSYIMPEKSNGQHFSPLITSFSKRHRQHRRLLLRPANFSTRSSSPSRAPCSFQTIFIRDL